jgi:hypothetical protein
MGFLEAFFGIFKIVVSVSGYTGLCLVLGVVLTFFTVIADYAIGVPFIPLLGGPFAMIKVLGFLFLLCGFVGLGLHLKEKLGY